MRSRLTTYGLAALLAGVAASDSAALVHHGGLDQQKVTTGRQPRLHRTLAWGTHASLPGWTVQWDRDTDTPAQMMGPHVIVTGAVADATIAEAAARAFLAQHLPLLAPGASLSDFTLLANRVDGDIRSVTFEQHASGLRIDGAAIGFSFKNDHLTLVSSTALPNARVVVPSDHLPRTAIESAASAWLGKAGHAVAARAGVPVERVILPLVHPHNHWGVDVDFRVAEQVSVEATQGTGRWDVFVDARDGTAFARRNTLRYATGTLQFNVPDHDPSHTRGVQLAPNDDLTINGTACTTDGDGVATFSGANPGALTPGVVGPFVTINNFTGTDVTDSLSIADGGTTVWDKSTDISSDAQLDAFVYASRAKTFAKTRLNPTLAYWDQNLSVTTNETDQGDCNAFSTGDDIHFFPRGSVPNGNGTTFNCENTGRISDVVFHEFGHSVHFQSIIPGMGQFDSSLSEGLADSFANSITGDHGVGIGFDLDHADAYLRDEGSGVVKRWPQDADGEPHDEGEIIAEAYVGIRSALEAKPSLGSAAGADQALKIYYSIVQRSPDIPDSITAALIGDDDDGDLTNGTPNECEIQQQMNIHGLGDPSFTVTVPPPARVGLNVTVTPTMPTQSGGCAFATVQSSVVAYHVRGGDGTDTTMALTDNGSGSFVTTLPAQDGQTVLYKVTTTMSDGTQFVYPDNKADPYYEAYAGAVTNIQCFDFEAGSDGWTKGGSLDEWQFGAPEGLDTNPPAAFDGTGVAGIDLDQDGDYSASSNQTLTSPSIALAGSTQVHLQYYRWLGVEDGAYDHAVITANGSAVWTNLASAGQPDPSSEINHLDREWVFEDVDLTAAATAANGGALTLAFHLDADEGLEFGGWAIDDVCVVAVGSAQAGAVCGNGVVDPGEQCDDGNTTSGDGCSATCQDETGSDGGGGKGGGGCCSTGGAPAGPAALGVMVLGMLLRRRKRA